ncbi:hypothetical protein JXB02_06585 [Candidatus Woesearchaeota archaeon]|nr:hypothetical protein [Candidatus Woesearchaeota archaeon]
MIPQRPDIIEQIEKRRQPYTITQILEYVHIPLESEMGQSSDVRSLIAQTTDLIGKLREKYRLDIDQQINPGNPAHGDILKVAKDYRDKISPILQQYAQQH